MAIAQNQNGFTLVELMVTIAVMVILVALATPSFVEFAERAALRGAADSLVATIGAAKEEAIKRDEFVRVDFKKMGDGVCVGAAVVANSTDDGCSCDEASSVCSIARYPESERDMKRVTLEVDPVFGTSTGFVFDPRTGMLDQLADAGSLTLGTSRGYLVSLRVNAMGRVSLCSPDAKGLSGLGAC